MLILRWLLAVLACVALTVATLIGFEVYDGEHLFGWFALGALLFVLSVLPPVPNRNVVVQRQ